MDFEKFDNEKLTTFREERAPEALTTLFGLVKLSPSTPVRSFYGMFALFLILYLIKKFLGDPFFHAIQVLGVSEREAFLYNEHLKFSQFAVLFILAPFFGVIFDRFGRRITVLTGLVTMLTALILERFFITSPLLMTIIHIGIIVITRVLLQPPMLADYIDVKTIGTVCALYSLIPMIGTSLGNFLLKTFVNNNDLHEQHYNIYIFFIVIMAIAVAIAYYTIFNTGYPIEAAVKASSSKSSPALIVATIDFVKGYVVRSPWLLAATLLGLLRGLDEEYSSDILAEMSALAYPLKALVFIVAGYILDEVFDLRILLGGIAIKLIGVIIQLLVVDADSWGMMMSWFLQNLGIALIALFQLVRLCRVTLPQHRGKVFGIFLSILISGRLCGYPLISQRLFALSEYIPYFLLIILMTANMIVVFLFYLTQKKKKPQTLNRQKLTSETRL
eukprot:TRINITY_DN9203_c0_g1_i3.p1 TRINITY_DN9203_c0_g1~~TRINITY_DN9203_c0_g1_i3.p1  ORF type:complete len:445 (-),score=60.49 TRINITY_DN9203_c0_g1_i3:54-1388(-)